MTAKCFSYPVRLKFENVAVYGYPNPIIFPSFNNSNTADNYAIFTLLFNAKVFTKFQQNIVIINRERARMR